MEEALVGACAAALERASGMIVTISGDELHVRSHGWHGRFLLAVRPRVAPSMGHVVWELADRAAQGRPVVLLTRCVSDRMGETLRAAGVAYIDAAGNTWLTDPPTLILVRGMKAEVGGEAGLKRRAHGRAFGVAGLRVVATLLADPYLAGRAYRNIAAAAGVSLGAASEAMADLRHRRFLTSDAGGRTLTRVAELHRRWLNGYADQLRPKLLLGRWRFADGGTGTALDRLGEREPARPVDANLGGEAAAARLTRHLRPQSAALHVEGRAGAAAAAKALRLLPDREGLIVMLDRIHGVPALSEPDGSDGRRADAANLIPLAHPLLVHAELAAVPDPDARLREAAELLYERWLRPSLERAEGDEQAGGRR